MMSIFEKRVQERDAELEGHWTQMLEAAAERDSAKMDLMTERAQWSDEKKVLQQQIALLEAQLKEREAAIEGTRASLFFPFLCFFLFSFFFLVSFVLIWVY